MQKWRQWQTASDSDWGVALEREAVIRPLVDQPLLTQEVVHHAAGQLGLSRAMLYRLVSRYRQRPQTSSLLPWKRGRDSKTEFLDREREDLVAACIKEFYLRCSGPRSRPCSGKLNAVLPSESCGLRTTKPAGHQS